MPTANRDYSTYVHLIWWTLVYIQQKYSARVITHRDFQPTQQALIMLGLPNILVQTGSTISSVETVNFTQISLVNWIVCYIFSILFIPILGMECVDKQRILMSFCGTSGQNLQAGEAHGMQHTSVLHAHRICQGFKKTFLNFRKWT